MAKELKVVDEHEAELGSLSQGPNALAQVNRANASARVSDNGSPSMSVSVTIPVSTRHVTPKIMKVGGWASINSEKMR